MQQALHSGQKLRHRNPRQGSRRLLIAKLRIGHDSSAKYLPTIASDRGDHDPDREAVGHCARLERSAGRHRPVD